MKQIPVFHFPCANLFYNENKQNKLFRKKAYAQKDIINPYADVVCFK